MTSTIYDDVLYDYQKDAAKRIADQRRILLADQPGLGKTLMVLSSLELADMYEWGKNILIITPIINAQTAWIDSIEKFVKPRYDVNVIDISRGTVHEKRDEMYTLNALSNIVIANHNAIDWMEGAHRVSTLTLAKFDAVIIDESHMVLPIRDHRKPTKFWEGLTKIRTAEDAMRIAVSGTPDRGKLENRYGTWLFLDPWNTKRNRWDWLAENFFMYEQKVNKTRTVKMVGAMKDQTAWLAKDKAMMVRRTKNEVLTQLPPKRYVDVEIIPHDEQFKDYLRLREEASKKPTKDGKPMEPMVFALRARQIADCQFTREWEPSPTGKSAKLDWLIEWLDSRGYADGTLEGKVVIASQFSKVLHWLEKELNKRDFQCEVLDGATPQSKRSAIQREFQDGPLRIVLLSGQMGVGITLDRADDLIMFDSPYDPDRVEQIEDRIHRASNMHKVTIWTLISVGTIDQAIMEKMNKRYKVTRRVLDGARGIQFEKDIVAKLGTKMSDPEGEQK